TAYLQLPAVAVAVIGTVICVVSAQRDVEFRDILKRKPAASSAVESSAKEIEEEDFFA
ncbi:PTS mannose transporter subunit IIC, partial [Listeria monocytogenes]|nr:PTS mannose transporter subunit IIC [Listeria monocytogenes]